MQDGPPVRWSNVGSSADRPARRPSCCPRRYPSYGCQLMPRHREHEPRRMFVLRTITVNFTHQFLKDFHALPGNGGPECASVIASLVDRSWCGRLVMVAQGVREPQTAEYVFVEEAGDGTDMVAVGGARSGPPPRHGFAACLADSSRRRAVCWRGPAEAGTGGLRASWRWRTGKTRWRPGPTSRGTLCGTCMRRRKVPHTR